MGSLEVFTFECAACGHRIDVFWVPPDGVGKGDSVRITKEFTTKHYGWIFEPESGIGFCSTDCAKGDR